MSHVSIPSHDIPYLPENIIMMHATLFPLTSSDPTSIKPCTMPTQFELARLAEVVPPPSGKDDSKVWLEKIKNSNSLNGTERRWQWYQPWLEERGYRLRPRYKTGWEPPDRRGHAEREDCVEQIVRVCSSLMEGKELNFISQHGCSTPPAFQTGSQSS